MLKRRDFLHYSAAAALAAAIDSKAPAAEPGAAGEWRNRQSGMSYRKLGRTGFMISEVVMGGNTIAPENYEHVLEALDRGLNYLDTAPAYGQGRSESGYARVLRARKRDSFFLNTKISLWDINRNKLYQDIFASLPEPEQKKLRTAAADQIAARRAAEPDYFGDYFNGQMRELEQAALANVMEKRYGRQIDREKNYKQLILDSIDQSLTRLGTDHVDLMMCPHGACTPYEVSNYPEVFDAFEVLRKAGKVRHLGVSAHNDPGGILEAAAATGKYAAAMVAYSVVNHGYVDAGLEKAAAAGMGVIAMKAARPLFPGANGSRTVPPERLAKLDAEVPGTLKVPIKAYAWALRNPKLAAVISEIINAGILRDNLPLAAPKRNG